jgi:uncharacterized protein involved in outer membrane biogenesis
MKWLKRSAIALGILLAILAALPLFISLNDYIPDIEREVSARLQEPVTIRSLRAAALPVPHLTVDGIAVGRTGDVKVGSVTVTPDLFSLLGSVKIIRSIEVDGLVLAEKAFDKIPVWAKPDSSKEPARVRIRNIRLDGAVVHLGKTSFGPFDARISISDGGEPQEAYISTRDGALKATVTPNQQNYLIDASAKSWKLPLGPPVLFDELNLKGTATLNSATLNEVSARLYGGTVKGTAALRWQKAFQLTGRFSVHQIELKDLVPLLSPGNRVSGRLDAKPVLSAKAANAAQLADALRLETPFNVQNGVLYGVDIQKAATNFISKEPTRGETRFDELSGNLVIERSAYRFTQLRIASGALAASGNVSISPAKELSGRINAEVKAASIASASMPLNVSGTVQNPLLLPTGGTVAGAAVGTAILGPGVGTSLGAKVGEWTEGLFGKKDQKR